MLLPLLTSAHRFDEDSQGEGCATAPSFCGPLPQVVQGKGQGGNKRAVRLAETETGEKVELPALLSSCPHCRREQVARSPVVALHVNQGRREQGVRPVVAVLYLNGPLPPGAHQGRQRGSRPQLQAAEPTTAPAPGSCPAIARLRADLVSYATSNTPQPAVAASCERRRRKVRAGPVCEVSASARAALTGSTITRDGRTAFPDGSPVAAPRGNRLEQLAGEGKRLRRTAFFS